MVEVNLQTPLADALNRVIQPKLVDVGWSTGGADDSALSEYIILMLVNGKSQDQIAAELSGDLLNLGPDDPGAIEFARWLFDQVQTLDRELNGGPTTSDPGPAEDTDPSPPFQASAREPDNAGLGQDTEMGSDDVEIHIPTEPRSMRNGNRGKRLFGQISKAMDRSTDAVLHRVRSHQGTERVKSHSREPPKGPRNMAFNRNPRMNNGRPPGLMPTGGFANGVPAVGMTPQQQMQLFAMYEEQARMMSQILSPQQQQMFIGGPPVYPSPMPPDAFGGGGVRMPPTPGRSLFERVEHPAHAGPRGFDKRPYGRTSNASSHAVFAGRRPPAQEADMADHSSSMDVDLSGPNANANADGEGDGDPGTTVCRFNLACTKADCLYAHQSPAAAAGTTIDVSDHCSFGAACKNRKCVGRHPSPAIKSTHQAEQDCKFFPNCANPACPFRHPDMPLCRNGADCTRAGCRFTHVKTACRFNPCLNPICPFKHVDGQKRGAFDDKVWVAGGGGPAGAGAGAGAGGGTHVSERKFVDDSAAAIAEELILPTSTAAAVASAETVT
ncbi:MAG: hypothetical protein M1826_001179 [Phylliscum demangeonii]|nr:MAG: hypothetical protein M1826_001179 [Phylliscum demangeonii]